MNADMKSTWRKLVGIALLWAGLAALVSIPTSGGGIRGTVLAVAGFVAFASGLALFAEGLKRDIVARLRRGAGEPAA